jgi:uncharacterized protein (TIGR02444 family)
MANSQDGGSPRFQDLWHFSLAFYRRPGVADACLALQDAAGVDVNVMLYLLYLAARGRGVHADDMGRIESVAAVWRDAVVVPLREIRRKLKAPLGEFAPAVTCGLRDDVKRIELAAERIEQQALESLIALGATQPDVGERLTLAHANMSAYADRLGPLPAEPLQTILDAFSQYQQSG